MALNYIGFAPFFPSVFLYLIFVTTGPICVIQKTFLSSGVIDVHWLGKFALKLKQVPNIGPKRPKSCLEHIWETNGPISIIQKPNKSPSIITVHLFSRFTLWPYQWAQKRHKKAPNLGWSVYSKAAGSILLIQRPVKAL